MSDNNLSNMMTMMLFGGGSNSNGGGIIEDKKAMMLKFIMILMPRYIDTIIERITLGLTSWYKKLNEKVEKKSDVFCLYSVSAQLYSPSKTSIVPIIFETTMERIYKMFISKQPEFSFEMSNVEYCKYNVKSMKLIRFDELYEIWPGIYVKTSTEDREDTRLYEKYKICNIKFYGTGMKDYEMYEKSCMDEHEQQRIKTFKTQQIITVTEIPKEGLHTKCVAFNTTKTFDNIFFDQKDELLEKLVYFRDNAEEYSRLGIPHTCGILLYGEPGCGKTSCIKAIAKFTGRHIIRIGAMSMKTFIKILLMDIKLFDVDIPNDKRLYVIEELDCGCFSDVVKCRKLKQKEYETNSKEDTFVKNLEEKEQKASGGTLGDLLEILDGIIEMPGRMMVFTSNRPEIIDDALLRHGRIDISLEIKKMSRKNISDMYKLWFNSDIPSDIFNQMDDRIFTQANIGNLFNRRNMEHIYEVLASNNFTGCDSNSESSYNSEHEISHLNTSH